MLLSVLNSYCIVSQATQQNWIPTSTMNRNFLLILAFFFGFTCFGQSIRLKHSLNDDSHRTISFTSENLSGTLSATPEKIELKIKNRSTEILEFKEDDFSLKSASGKGAELCSSSVTLAPGKSTNLVLRLCEQRDYLGLFGLRSSYNSKAEFREASLFLIDQKFLLKIGSENVSFFTTH